MSWRILSSEGIGPGMTHRVRGDVTSVLSPEAPVDDEAPDELPVALEVVGRRCGVRSDRCRNGRGAACPVAPRKGTTLCTGFGALSPRGSVVGRLPGPGRLRSARWSGQHGAAGEPDSPPREAATRPTCAHTARGPEVLAVRRFSLADDKPRGSSTPYAVGP